VPQSKRHPARRPQRRTPKSGHRNPAAPAAAPVPATSTARRELNRRSAGPLVILHRMPTWLVPVLLAVLLVAGLALPFRAAGILLLVIAAFLGWLLALSWPITSPGGRVLRVVTLVALVGAATARFTGHF